MLPTEAGLQLMPTEAVAVQLPRLQHLDRATSTTAAPLSAAATAVQLHQLLHLDTVDSTAAALFPARAIAVRPPQLLHLDSGDSTAAAPLPARAAAVQLQRLLNLEVLSPGVLEVDVVVAPSPGVLEGPPAATSPQPVPATRGQPPAAPAQAQPGGVTARRLRSRSGNKLWKAACRPPRSGRSAGSESRGALSAIPTTTTTTHRPLAWWRECEQPLRVEHS